MKAINIELTKWQTEMLGPLFDATYKGYKAGDPVAVFAQVWENLQRGGLAFMEVRIIDGEKCKAIQAATGVEVGRIPDGKGKNITILAPCEDDNKRMEQTGESSSKKANR